jgi:hypothetical protein
MHLLSETCTGGPLKINPEIRATALGLPQFFGAGDSAGNHRPQAPDRWTTPHAAYF